MELFPPALPIPSSLGYLVDNATASSPIHTERNWMICVGKPASVLKEIAHLPGQLSKLTFVSSALNIEKASLKPLTEALTSTKLKSLAEKLQALEINKIILRYVYDDFLLQKSVQEFIFGSFICQMALTNSLLKDEIYCQLMSHSIENSNEAALRRVWTLLANLMGVAAPSTDMFNYVLKQASDHAYKQYTALCQHILLHCSLHNRLYPASTLEWKVNTKCAKYALEIHFADNKSIIIGVGNFSTTEEVARLALRIRTEMTSDFAGWSVVLKHNSRQVECGGHGYVFDLISSIEMPLGWSEVTGCVLEDHFLISDSSPKSASRTNIATLEDFSRSNSNEFPSANGILEQHIPTPDLNRWLKNVSDPISMNSNLFFNDHRHINGNQLQWFINGGGGMPMNKSYQNQLDRANELKAALESEKLETAILEQSLQKIKLQKELARIQTEDKIPVPNLTTENSTNESIQNEKFLQKLGKQNAFPSESLSTLHLSKPTIVIKDTDNSNTMVDNKKPAKVEKFKWPPESKTNSSPEKPQVRRLFIEESDLNSKNPPISTTQKNVQPGISVKPKLIALESQEKPLFSDKLTNSNSKDLETNAKVDSNFKMNKVSRATEPPTEYSTISNINVSKLAKKMEGLLVMQIPSNPVKLKETTNHISVEQSSAQEKSTTAIHNDLRENNNFIHFNGQPPPPPPLPPGTEMKTVQVEQKIDTVDLTEIQRTPSSKFVQQISLPPVPTVPAPPTPASSMARAAGRSNSNRVEAEATVATKLHVFNDVPHYMYTLVRWTLVIHKEVFLPSEMIETPQLVNLLFCQIVLDIYAAACIRLDSVDRGRIDSFLLSNAIERRKCSPEILIKEPHHVKKQVIELAKSTPFYFSRNFACSWWKSDDKSAQPLMTESDVHWLSVSHSGIRLAFQTRSIASSEEHLACQHHIAFNDVSEVIVNDIRVIVIVAKSRKFKLFCEYAVEAKVMIEAFILDYYKYLQLLERQEVSHRREEDNSSWLALSNNSIISPRISLMFNEFETNDSLSMVEYASKYFRKARDYGYMGMACKDLVEWSRQSEHGSFRKLSSQPIESLAVDCHLAVMAFMHDYPLPRETEEIDRINFLLKHAKASVEISDEIFIMLCKQTTNNNSPNHNSLIRGWILFSIIASHCNCSHELKPYIIYYLQQNQNNGWSKHTYHNFTKSIEYGNRHELPNAKELRAINSGCSEKRLRIRMPGKLENIVHISPSTIAKEVVENLCEELSVTSRLEQSEYGLIYIEKREGNSYSLSSEEYLFDVLSSHEEGCHGQFYFLRKSWFASLQLDSCHSSLLQFFYNQIQKKYLTGHWILAEHGSHFTHKQMDEVVQLAALQMGAMRLSSNINMKIVRDTLPLKVEQMCPELTPQLWVEKVCSAYRTMQIASPPQYWVYFIHLLADWQLFGSSTFIVSIRHSSYKSFQLNLDKEMDVILAIGANGLTFVDQQHRYCMASHSLDALEEITCVEDNCLEISARDFQRERNVTYTIFTNNVNDILHVFNHHIKLNKLKNEF